MKPYETLWNPMEPQRNQKNTLEWQKAQEFLKGPGKWKVFPRHAPGYAGHVKNANFEATKIGESLYDRFMNLLHLNIL